MLRDLCKKHLIRKTHVYLDGTKDMYDMSVIKYWSTNF